MICLISGAVIVFTGLMSHFGLHRRLGLTKWIGIAIVIAGLTVVGLCDMVFLANDSDDEVSLMAALNGTVTTSDNYVNNGLLNQIILGLGGEMNKSTSQVILGDLLIVGSQVINY